MYAHAIVTNFRRHLFNLNTTVPYDSGMLPNSLITHVSRKVVLNSHVTLWRY